MVNAIHLLPLRNHLKKKKKTAMKMCPVYHEHVHNDAVRLRSRTNVPPLPIFLHWNQTKTRIIMTTTKVKKKKNRPIWTKMRVMMKMKKNQMNSLKHHQRNRHLNTRVKLPLRSKLLAKSTVVVEWYNEGLVNPKKLNPSRKRSDNPTRRK